MNNTYLSESYSTDNFDIEVIKAKSLNLKTRVENDNKIIHPYYYYIKKYAMPTILFAPIITSFINLIFNLVQTPIVFNFAVFIDFLLGLSIMVLLVLPNLKWFINIKQSRKSTDTSIYVFYENMMLEILDAIRLKLRMIQFPREEKYKVLLIEAMKNITEKFTHDPTQD